MQKGEQEPAKPTLVPFEGVYYEKRWELSKINCKNNFIKSVNHFVTFAYIFIAHF